MNKNVNVLGTEYEISEDPVNNMEGMDGICRMREKKISVRLVGDLLEDGSTLEAKIERKKEVLRHELIHAFFFESGLEDYCDNEQLVDWLAKQMPKIIKACNSVEAL